MPRKKKNKPVSDTSDKTAQKKHRAKIKDLGAPPPRTSGYSKKTGTQVSGAEIVDSSANAVTYQWTEDKGGEKVKVKRRTYMKEHAEPMREDDWVSINGSTCKINRSKFDPNYEEIFGKKNRGAATGKFKKFKKSY